MNSYEVLLISLAIVIGYGLILFSRYYKYITLNNIMYEALNAATVRMMKKDGIYYYNINNTEMYVNKMIYEYINDNANVKNYSLLLWKDVSIFFYENKKNIIINKLLTDILNLVGTLIFFTALKTLIYKYQINGLNIGLIGLYLSFEVSNFKLKVNRKSIANELAKFILKYDKSVNRDKNKILSDMIVEYVIKSIPMIITSILLFTAIGFVYYFITLITTNIPYVEIIIIGFAMIIFGVYIINSNILKSKILK
ncbi:hypothetical protein [Clostridium thermobutyricum]|uniref:hypothetical protein n=1 Tax=Clostridium thermobutyricum TaxID=29372 RepID=UPI0018AA1F65|nr:hypothetical protein [Clostridium thermobutyricum]